MMSSAKDDGFTLVELLVAIVILGAVMAAITGAIIVGLRTTDATNQRLSLSHDAQIASAYWAKDVQSATEVRTDTTAPSGAPATCGTTTGLVARFDWKEEDTGIHKAVVYVLNPVANGERVLQRSVCSGSSTPVSSNPVAHYVDTVTLACPVTGDDAASCPASGTSRQVKLVVNGCARDSSDACITSSAYSFTVRGSRRAA